MYLEDIIGKDKDDNTVTLKEVIESNDKSIEDEVDLKIKMKTLYQKIKDILKDRERTIIKLRFGLEGGKPKTQKEIAICLRIFIIDGYNKKNSIKYVLVLFFTS